MDIESQFHFILDVRNVIIGRLLVENKPGLNFHLAEKGIRDRPI